MLDAIRRLFAPRVKASAAGPAVSVGRVGQAIWTDRNFDGFAEEAYVRNAVAFRCIKMISRAAATIPWLLYDGKDHEIEKHKLLSLLARPAPNVAGHTLFEAVYAYLLIAGNSYLESVAPGSGPPRELWSLRPDRMKVVPGAFGMPQGFEYSVNGQTVTWQVDPLTGAGPILHLKEFHPRNDWYGLSPVEPASYSIDRHNAAVEHNTALIQNGARPTGALVFKPILMPGGAVQRAPDDVIAAAEQRLQSRHQGAENAGRPLVLGGDIDWKQMGLTPRDMDFNESKLDAARDICLAFGVPHILIVHGQSTYNNIREAKLELYEETVLPIVDHVVDELNLWLCPQFGDGLRLDTDKDEIPALSLRRELKQKATVELFDKRLITRDEARAALQYDEADDDARKEMEAGEKADVAFKKAQAAKLHADSGLIPDEVLGPALENQLEEDGVYPGLAEARAKAPDATPADDITEEDVAGGDDDERVEEEEAAGAEA